MTTPAAPETPATGTTPAPVAPVAAPAAPPAQPAQPAQPPAPLSGAPLTPPAAPPVAQPPAPRAAEPAAPKAAEGAGDVDALRGRVDAMVSAFKRAEVMRIAERFQAADPNDVYELTSKELDVVDGAVVVKGQPTVTLETWLGAWLQKKPHFLRPAAPGGGAGAPPVPQPPAAPERKPVHTAEGGTQVAQGFLARKYAHLNSTTTPGTPPGNRS
mgnify:CR=1 FL=1